jgi:hypothetical protein
MRDRCAVSLGLLDAGGLCQVREGFPAFGDPRLLAAHRALFGRTANAGAVTCGVHKLDSTCKSENWVTGIEFAHPTPPVRLRRTTDTTPLLIDRRLERQP